MANYNKGTSWLERQKKDKKRRETEPTMREAAQASRVQYTLPEYKGRSDVADTKSYKWETEILKDVKGMGRSYNDKFSNLTKSWGMTGADAREFRRYMDFQEDSKQKIRTNKDGSMHGSASSHLGQGASLVDDSLNKLIAGTEKKTTAQYKARIDAQVKEQEHQRKIGEVKAGQEREGFISKVDDTLNRLSRSINDNFLPKSVIDQMEKNDQKVIDKQLASDNEKMFKKGIKNQKTLNAVNSQAVTGLEKGTEITGDVIAEIMKYVPAYKGVNALMKGAKIAPKSKIVNDLVRGGAAGFGVGNANATLDQLNDPNATKGDYASRVALETLLAGGGDAAGGAILRNLNLKGQAGQLLDDLGGKQLTPEEMQVVAQAMELKPSGNPSNVLASTPTPTVPNAAVTGNNILDEMINGRQPITGPEALVQPEPQSNKVLDDWFNFAQQPRNIKSRPLGPLDSAAETVKKRPIGYYKDLYEQIAKSDGSEFADDIAGLQEQSRMIDEDMLSERERMVSQYMADRQANNALHGQRDMSPEEFRSMQEQAGALEQQVAAQSSRDVFQNPEYQKMMEPLDQYDKAHAEWNATKELTDRDQYFKNQYGKISIPEENWADWGKAVPARYRANRGTNKGMDIYAVADTEGISPDELVKELQNAAESTKVRKKDFITDDLKWLDDSKAYETRLNRITELKSRLEAEGANTPEAAQLDEMIRQLENPVAPDMTPQWRQEAEDAFANSDYFKNQSQVLKAIQDDIELHSNPTKEMIYKRLKKEGDPEDFNRIVDLYIKDMSDFEELTFKQSLMADPRINEGIRALSPQNQLPEPMPATQVQPVPEIDPLEELTQSLAPKPKQTKNDINNILRSLSEEAPAPPELMTPQLGEDGLLRSNLQAFNEAPTNSMVNTSEGVPTVNPIESVSNPLVRFKDKFYKGLFNRSHNFKVAEVQTLEKRIADAATPEEAATLKEQLKTVKKTTSEADKALQIESASGTRTINFLNNHFTNLSKSLGKGATDKEVSEATQYMMAKNLQWQRDMGKISDDHQLVKGWDWGRVNQEVAVGDQNPAFQEYQKAFKAMTQELLNERQLYGLIDDAAHKALSENPYYIPMERDFSYMKDNIDKSMGLGQSSNHRSIDNYELHSLGEGDLRAFYKNPLETITNAAHTVFRNSFKSDTGEQLAKLAALDTDKMFVKTLSEAEAKKNPGNVYEFFQNGEKKYLRLQDDLMKTIKENEEAADLGVLGKVTQLFARMKTSSLEYQTAAVPRDLAQSYMTSQAGPIEFFVEAFKAVKSKNASAKELGAYFEKAYSDTTGGIDPKEVTKQFAAQNPNFTSLDPKNRGSVRKLASTMIKIGKLPFKPGQKVGQYTDELPRSVETQIVAKKFQPKMDDINAQIKTLEDEIASVPQSGGDFDAATQGIDNKGQELMALKQQQRSLVRDMRREQTYRGLDVINYNRGGSGKFAKWIRQNIIFANTTTQSKDKMIRAFREKPGNFLTKAAIVAAPFVTAQQIMHDHMSDSDREMYEGLPDYMKNTNYIYVHDGDVIAVPKVHELALITNPIEAALKGEPLDDSARMAVKELLPYQTGTILQGLVPGEDEKESQLNNSQMSSSVFSPGIDVLANQKLGFNQKPISYSAKFKQDASEQQANDWTLESLKGLMGDNPNADRLEYLIKQYGGDAGKYVVHGADYLDSLRTGDNKKDRLDLMLQNLNPLQDRYYTNKNRTFKSPPQETKKK